MTNNTSQSGRSTHPSRESALALADCIIGDGRALATLEETASGLTLAASKIRADVRRGLIHPTRLGRRLAFSRDQIADYIVALHDVHKPVSA